MTAADWLTAAKTKLSDLDSRLILESATGLSREKLLSHPETTLTVGQLVLANQLMADRLAGRPLSQIRGQREFYGLDFIITPDVLTPRTETETLVEQAIALAPQNGRLLDVGTGSGAIAVALGKHRPDLKITATDLSAAALKVARRNAAKHSVKVQLVQSDLLANISGDFDLVTANLPYLRNDADLMPEVANHEPKLALLGGADGLELYRRFFGQLPAQLVSGGHVLIEADPWQHADLIKLAADQGFNLAKADYFIVSFSKH